MDTVLTAVQSMDSSVSPSSTLGTGSVIQQSAIQTTVSRWLSYVVGAPKATKSFAILIVSFYLVTHIILSSGPRPYPMADILGLVPGYTFSSLYVWNIFTAGFYHAYFIDMVLSIATLLVVGKYLEPFWGMKEFVKFVVMVNAWSGLGCVVWNVGAYVTSSTEAATALLFPIVPYGGFGGVVSAFAVVGRQLIPEYEMPILGVIPFRMKHVPFLLLITNGVWHMLGFPVSSYSFTFVGTLTAWIYLRYFQVRSDAHLPVTQGQSPSSADANQAIVKGDRSDATSFIGFFPDVFHPVLNKVFFCCALSPLSLSTSSSARSFAGLVTSSNAQATPSAPPALPADLEADRRRLSALQQVDARIAKMKAAKVQSTPTGMV